MSSLQQHVVSILVKSANAAADEIIKLFDSSFEAFSEELRERQQEINTLKWKLELAEAEQGNLGQAYLCGQCGVSFSSMTLLEEHHKALHAEDGSHLHAANEMNDVEGNETVEVSEEETEQRFEFEVLGDEDTYYSHLIFADKGTEETPAVPVEQHANNAESTPTEQQKRGRGRPRKHRPEVVREKRGRGRPRKTEETGSILSQSTKYLKHKMKREQLILENENKCNVNEIQTDVTLCQKTVEKQEFGDSVKPQTLFFELNNHNNTPNSVTTEPQKPVSTISTKESKPSNKEVRDILGTQLRKRGRGRPKKMIPREFYESDSKSESTQKADDKPDNEIRSNSQTNVDSTGSETLFVPFGEAKSKLNVQENLMLAPKTDPENTQKKSIANTCLQNGKRWIGCPQCPRVFKSKAKLQVHQKIHLKKGESSCRTCGMTFIGRIQMENHERVHTGEKPYSCNFCPKRFPVLSQLKKHMLNHTSMAFPCNTSNVSSSQECSDKTQREDLLGEPGSNSTDR